MNFATAIFFNAKLYCKLQFFRFFRIDPETSGLELFASVDLLAQSPIPTDAWHYPYQVQLLKLNLIVFEEMLKLVMTKEGLCWHLRKLLDYVQPHFHMIWTTVRQTHTYVLRQYNSGTVNLLKDRGICWAQ